MITQKLVITTVLASSLSMFAGATEFSAVDKSIETTLCIKAVEGNRVAMYIEMKNSGYSNKFITSKINCNGKNILAFVEEHGNNAESMLNMLDKRTRQTSITDIAQITLEDK